MYQRWVPRFDSLGPELQRDVAAEFNPLYYQFDDIAILPGYRGSTQLLVAGQVVAGRLSKIEARQILRDLGLAELLPSEEVIAGKKIPRRQLHG